MTTRWRLALLGLLIILTTGCDQATKSIARDDLRFAPARSYAGDLVRIQYAENQGGFLGLGADLPDHIRPWLFTVGVAALLVGLLVFALVGKGLGLSTVVALALFVGGGLSNLIDRLVYGDHVVDLLSVGIGPLRTGVFNLADVFIMAGVALLALSGHGLGGLGRPAERPPD